MPGGDCRLKLLLVVTVLCLYCMISTLISVTRHAPTSHLGPGTNVYFIAMFPLELQTKVGEYLTITIMEKAPTRAFSVIVETSLKVRLKL